MGEGEETTMIWCPGLGGPETAGPFSVIRLNMDLPFDNLFALKEKCQPSSCGQLWEFWKRFLKEDSLEIP